MLGFRNLSIRQKLTRIILLTTGVSLVLSCTAFVIYDRMVFRRGIVQDLEMLAGIAGSSSTAALAFNDPNPAGDVLEDVAAEKRIVTACIYSQDGKVFASYHRSDARAEVCPPAPKKQGGYFGNNRAALSRRILLAGEPVGTVYLESDLEEMHARLGRYAALVGLILLGSLFVASVLSSRLQRVISEPIHDLARTALAVSVGRDYSVRAAKHGRDEMGFLVDRFNEMLDQIQRRNEELRRHRENLEEQVAARTAELTAANEQLEAAKEKAEEARARTELLLNSTAEAIYGVDLHGNCTLCNPACLRILGYHDASEVLGKDMHHLIHHRHPDGTPYPVEECRISEAFRKGEGTHVDDEVLWRADGTSFPAEYWSYPIRHGEEIVGAVVTFLDITERKSAEDALQRSLKELADFKSAMDEHCIMARTDPKGRMTFVNDKFCEISQYSREELLGQDHRIVNSGHHPKEFFKNLWETIISGRVWKGEVKNRKKDGSFFWVMTTVVPFLDPKGKPYQYVAIRTDVTDRKKVLEELEQAKAAAEAASRAKSEFLANMSHEIRTPLNGIMGMTELALDTPLNSEQREYLVMVKSSGDALLTVINDILDFSKIEAGKIDFDPIEFDLREAIRDALKPLAVRAEQKGLEMIYRIAPEIPDRLIADPGRLRQVVVNVVGNAVKFTDRGEVLVEVQIEQSNGREVCLHFRIRDTGIGIPPQQQQRIFEAFEQADTSMSRRFGGTGLGLTISARLVKMMRGRVWVESEAGQGSTFHFTAWLGIPESSAAQVVPAEPAALEGLSALVVDDNATNRRILEELLCNWRMHPESAPDGSAGLTMMQQALKDGKPFRLVLVDAQMPGLGGFELAQRIKEDPELAGATIMMLCSGGQRGDAARCRELGIAAYLTKPVTQSELLDAILLAMGQPARDGQSPQVITRHSIREGERRLRILLAEDNPVNQRMVVRLLEKQGHEVVVAGNGTEALVALEKQSFDLVLMDVQMPVTDGFEATAAIRAKENTTGTHIPVIALTAHAMKGDKERCLAAGMDGYLSKPIRNQELIAMIEDMQKKLGHESEARSSQSRPEPVADWDAALKRLDGDRALLAEMLDLFLADCPRATEAIHDALAHNDSKELERAAHTLKGTLANFSASPAFTAAQELEMLARAGDLANVAEVYGKLEKQIERLKAEMASFRREVGQ